ncbi:MAG: dihydrolipoamide acetyltransferase family protein [Pseudomonadota bacterium]|nr:dihydrolipoamide acetyltransferase family protein [Pseudomonadota bacterium]
MSEIKTFFLPDLGEGLPDAEIVEWHVQEGDVVLLDAALVSMETAKAVVDVPSPFSGRVVKLHGKAGSVIDTGGALVEVELDAKLPQRKDVESTGHHHGAKPVAAIAEAAPTTQAIAVPLQAIAAAVAARTDEGTVVGAMQSSNEVRSDVVTTVGGVKAMPAVRALAKKLGVDLTRIRGSGPDGIVSLQDVKSAPPSAPVGTASTAALVGAASAAIVKPTTTPTSTTQTPPPAIPRPVRTAPPTVTMSGQPEQLRGVRRNMARIMAAAHASVVPTTLCDDADIHAWLPGTDITARLVRAIVAAAKTMPALNAWFDMENATRTLHSRVDIGIAVDTDDGLFVPVLRNADMLDANGIRAAVNRLRDQVMDRSIAGDELKGSTISLSNFGMFAGRYATPVIVPPSVAIIAAGRGRHQVVPVMGGIETHKTVPLSLTFDHRAATGGEAARFLKAMLDDLAQPL